MSGTIGSIIACPNIQEDLNTQFTKSDPTGAVVPQGLSDFIDSPQNTNGFLQAQNSPGAGKQRTVTLLYTPQILEADVSDDAVKKCVSTNEAGQLSKDYQLDQDQGAQYDEVFNISHLAAMCKDNALWFAQRLQAIMDAIDQKMGTDIATQAAVLFGKYGTGETGVTANIKTIRTRKTTSGDFDIDGLEEITYAAQNAGYRSLPVIFGFGEIYKYFRRVAAGCCALDGIDISAYYANNQAVFVADKKVQLALGTEDFLMLAPGALQLLSWLEFEGPFNMIDDGIYKQMVITNPKNGRKYDMQLKNDCGVLSVSVKKAYKVVGLPTDMYQVGSNFNGVTFVNKFAINNS